LRLDTSSGRGWLPSCGVSFLKPKHNPFPKHIAHKRTLIECLLASPQNSSASFERKGRVGSNSVIYSITTWPPSERKEKKFEKFKKPKYARNLIWI